jgi:hypothetical protein
LKADPPPASAGEPARAGEPPLIALRWRRTVLVCGKCEKRKDGPRHLAAKDVRRELARALRGGDRRLVLTGCLGPCVRKALTVVSIDAQGVRALALGRDDDLAAAARRLDSP